MTTSMNYHGYAPFNEEPELTIFLVGLFGLNAPFFLRQTQASPAKYKILAFVNLVDKAAANRKLENRRDRSEHKWGHQFWKDAEAGEKHQLIIVE
jgi:hypothetical protein